MGAVAVDEAEEGLERMAADVKPEQLLFVGELFGIGPLGQVTQAGGDFLFLRIIGFQHAEQRFLTACAVRSRTGGTR